MGRLVAPIIPNPRKIKSFRTEAAFEAWLAKNHARETELWLKVHKKASGLPTVTYAQALDVALQRHVEAAKADGRWAAAYAPIRLARVATIPDDLRAAIEANPRARKKFRALSGQNLFALAFRTNNMRTAAGRAKKIADLVDMLARGETIVPERQR